MNIVPLRALPQHSIRAVHQVHVLKAALTPVQCKTLCLLRGAARMHHSDDDPIGVEKNLNLQWVASLVESKIDAAMVSPYRPLRIDPMMRLYCLEAGRGVVPPHVDRDFTDDAGAHARFSILMYLNSGYVGGETVFNSMDVAASADTGDALLFRHDMLHEGRVVLGGTKFVLKTDLFVE